MNLFVNIYHNNPKHNFKVKASIDIVKKSVIYYLNKTFKTKLSDKEIKLIEILLSNNSKVPNNIKYISKAVKTSVRTCYRIRKNLIKLGILSIQDKYITFSKYTFKQFIVIAKF